MATKKNFESMKTGNLSQIVAQATTTTGKQSELTPEEAEARAEAMQTQGRKGCKALRISMAFSPSNSEFIRRVSKASGYTMTEFVNRIVTKYRKEHPEYMEQVNQFADVFGSGDLEDED